MSTSSVMFFFHNMAMFIGSACDILMITFYNFAKLNLVQISFGRLNSYTNMQIWGVIKHIDKRKSHVYKFHIIYWATHDGDRQCGIFSSNLSESFNSILKNVHGLMVKALVSTTFYRNVMHSFKKSKHRLAINRTLIKNQEPKATWLYQERQIF